MLTREAAADLSAIVGEDNFKQDAAVLESWTRNTIDSPRDLAGIISPGTQDEVQKIVMVCRKHKLRYHPMSTGKNWGYGGATPVANGVLILSLARLNRIVEFSSDLSYVVVEPGVTQQDLHEYLRKNGHDYMVPTTGAGPTASVLGNAIERGYGITPIEDHFAAVLSLKAVLPDGGIYRSALHELGGEYVDRLFKWKIGPYLDGLFTQSGLGVVVEGTIALAPKPDNVTQFIVFLREGEFESGVAAVREIKLKLGGLVGGVNMMNKRRLLSIIESKWDREKVLEEIRIIELARKRDLPDWAIVGALYGPKELTRGGLRLVKSICRGFSEKVVYLDRRKLEFAERALKILPLKKLRLLLANASRVLEILEGTPSAVALPLAYLRNPRGLPSGDFNPDRDNCGLIWFAPLVPLDAPVARDYVQETTRICLLNEIEPMITLTAFSPRCLDSTVPIIFQKEQPGAAEAAKRCYDELLRMSADMGLFPYRLDIDHMDLFDDLTIPAFDLIHKIKKALDPDLLLAPGRYAKGDR